MKNVVFRINDVASRSAHHFRVVTLMRCRHDVVTRRWLVNVTNLATTIRIWILLGYMTLGSIFLYGHIFKLS